jgi:hypothetical protein
MRPLITDATTALVRALRGFVAGLDPACGLVFEDLRSRAWASVTFSGARHELQLLLSGENAATAAGQFTERLGDAEFRLRGHLLADIALVSSDTTGEGVRLRLEALTVED